MFWILIICKFLVNVGKKLYDFNSRISVVCMFYFYIQIFCHKKGGRRSWTEGRGGNLKQNSYSNDYIGLTMSVTLELGGHFYEISN